jgi:hypothetical protein
MSNRSESHSTIGATRSAQRHPKGKIRSLTFRRLLPAHVPALVRLEQETFPATLRLGAARYYYFLSTSEIKGQNYSIGVFDKDELVGYSLMVQHPSEFHPGKEAPYMISMAVRFHYRRAVVPMLMARMVREAFLVGYHAEGKMREATAFRMIQRKCKDIHRQGVRITGMKEIERVGNDRLILVRFEHVFARDPLVWRTYRAITGIERTRRVLRALPRRVLRKICRMLPAALVSSRLRRWSYLEQIEESEQ